MDEHLPQRRSIRLHEYDYSQAGAYFVTICAFRRIHLFGEVARGRVELTEIGNIINQEWLKSLTLRRELMLDRYVIMPDHMHGIVIIQSVGAHGRAPAVITPNGRAHSRAPLRPTRSLGSFIAQFKAAVTARVNAMRGMPGEPVWQRGYYEHVIRHEQELTAARAYICDNPAAWSLSEEYPPMPNWERSPSRR